jgi:hypothetical protein
VQALFDSGRIIDIILIGVAVEAALAVWLLRRSARSVLGIGANLAAGACLLLAVRAAIVGSEWMWPAFWILLALPAHLIDLVLRLVCAGHKGSTGPRSQQSPFLRGYDADAGY